MDTEQKIDEVYRTTIKIKTVLLGANGDGGLVEEVKCNRRDINRNTILISILLGSGILGGGIYGAVQLLVH